MKTHEDVQPTKTSDMRDTPEGGLDHTAAWTTKPLKSPRPTDVAGTLGGSDMRPMGRFAGRVVWITGAGHGIGAATALRIAEEGGHVAALALHEESAAAIARQCEGLAGRALALRADAGDPDALVRAHAMIQAELGPVDILINNVAIAEQSHLLDSTDAHWRRILSVNFESAVRCSRLVLPKMIERRRGTIVNLASNQGSRGFPGWGAYASAKGALLAFTRELAVEVAEKGVRVNAVTPGVIKTEMQTRLATEADDPGGYDASLRQAIPMRRSGSPSEVAAVIAFVASDEASFMTGAEVFVDGGEHIQGG